MSTLPRVASCLLRHQSRLQLSFICHRRLAWPTSSKRSISTTILRNAALATKPAAHPTVVLSTPSPEYLETEEPDTEVLPQKDIQLVITDRAAEHLRAMATRENNPDAALRIEVQSGGCHGYKYEMKLATSRSPDDYHFSHPTLQPSNVLVDAVSFPLLNGSTIDFATELIGSSFRVSDNPRAKGSGCGCGVSWELKD